MNTDGMTVGAATRAEVDWMVKAHYIGKWPAVVMAILALRRQGIPIGVAIYALPPKQTFKRYGGTTWELARLWVQDEEPTNTESRFIARTVAWIKRNHPDVHALVSYADPSAGHTGAIYRAANWTPDGRTDEGRKTPRFDIMCDGVKYSRLGRVPPGRPITRIPRVSKYRFVKLLHKGKPWPRRDPD